MGFFVQQMANLTVSHVACDVAERRPHPIQALSFSDAASSILWNSARISLWCLGGI